MVKLPFDKEEQVSLKILFKVDPNDHLQPGETISSLFGEDFGSFYSKIHLVENVAQDFVKTFILEIPINVNVNSQNFFRFQSPLNGYQQETASNKLQFIYKHNKGKDPSSPWEFYRDYQNDFVDLEWSHSIISKMAFEFEFKFKFRPDHMVPEILRQSLMMTKDFEDFQKKKYFFGLNGLEIDQKEIQLENILPVLKVHSMCFDMKDDFFNGVSFLRTGKFYMFSDCEL